VRAAVLFAQDDSIQSFCERQLTRNSGSCRRIETVKQPALATFQPGWKWSTCVKPIAKTETCQASHLAYHISGRLRVRMDDGTEEEFGPGDLAVVPPGHDAWVVGDQPVVLIDITGMAEYSKPG
jgi:mannose-6-phosphate isomerase-like protein (cupin superfamily)